MIGEVVLLLVQYATLVSVDKFMFFLSMYYKSQTTLTYNQVSIADINISGLWDQRKTHVIIRFQCICLCPSYAFSKNGCDYELLYRIDFCI